MFVRVYWRAKEKFTQITVCSPLTIHLAFPDRDPFPIGRAVGKRNHLHPCSDSIVICWGCQTRSAVLHLHTVAINTLYPHFLPRRLQCWPKDNVMGLDFWVTMCCQAMHIMIHSIQTCQHCHRCTDVPVHNLLVVMTLEVMLHYSLKWSSASNVCGKVSWL